MQRAAVSDRGRGYGGLRRGLQGPFLSRKLNKRSIGQREMLRRLRNTWIIIALSLSPSLPLSISLSLSFAVSVWRNKEAIKLQTSSAATTTTITIRNHSSSFYWRPSSWFGMEKVSLCSSFNRERETPATPAATAAEAAVKCVARADMQQSTTATTVATAATFLVNFLWSYLVNVFVSSRQGEEKDEEEEGRRRHDKKGQCVHTHTHT